MKNISPFPLNILCFSHLRWDFVYQRPQHLLTRFAQNCKVLFFEEPVFDVNEGKSFLSYSQRQVDVWVIVPHLPGGLNKSSITSILTELVDSILSNEKMETFAFWYYTPMALEFTSKYTPALTVYDCMDELSAFKFAPEELKSLEKKLMAKADLVFTGGQSLYEAKKTQHANIYPFPSSIEKEHFASARTLKSEPEDQINIKGPKIGFYGVIDERFDINLIDQIAEARPEWQIILIGPVVKIDPATLPRHANIHYLGSKTYNELPAYLSGWDVSMIPFLLNDSTRFISPTKTPEYLAAGIPVVSTAIRDVVHPYGVNKLVHIGSNASDFIRVIDLELKSKKKSSWLVSVDHFLANNSWDITYSSMHLLIQNAIMSKNKISIAS
ncbi:Glycosyltransferase [Arcticibacter svalbardensis MN12-7]|uniref:Glycosyltransferase n=1 Tax=Arcticibacter svalbardensis MN12-7 TaxID=1150600 RepID=R9GM81_9SPHI|nr:glycosyltransferase family 1 protein [Arcticibacter svalbardensis]EOR92947.1 Glycosyltransferase [Arcticibacter svalbardensis MN12-7]